MELDGRTGVLLTHEPPKRPRVPVNLKQAVHKLKLEEAGRENRFDRKVAEQRDQGGDLEKKFAGLLRKEKGKKPTRPAFRDIDLD